MDEPIVGFDWGDGNSHKCQKHGLSLAEIEAAFTRRPLIAPDPMYSDQEQRFIAIGRDVGGRPMFIAFTYRNRGSARLIRPVRARYMHKKEVWRYEARAQDDD